MPRLLMIVGAALSWFVLLSPSVDARDLHVSPNGDDAADGTAAAPLQTISAAADRAQPGDVVTVHAGVYRERITPPRGGTSDQQRIVYRAAPGEEVVITGSEVVTGWQHVQGDVWKAVVPNTFFGDYNPFADEIRGDWFSPRGRKHHTGDVYLDGQSRWEASSLQDVLEPKDEHPHWFAEVAEDTTTIWANFDGANPNQRLVEVNVRRACFYPDRPEVNFITVRGFTMRHAATQWAPPTAEQIGLIGTHWSKGWVIEDNHISDSRCTGVTLGKYGDQWDNTSQDTATGYVETIDRALENGWSKERIGSHVVRRNVIHQCGQAGIVGSMGAAFCLVEDNHIYDIWTRRHFGGAEMGGIKFHGAVDTIIRRNHVHNAGRGIWLDWMTQGTRVTRNLLYDNTTDDLLVEVNHGPFLIDNNIMLSPTSVLNWSQGGAYVHNLLAGKVVCHPELHRDTPYLVPHGTDVAGLSKTQGGDDRWLNNVFLGGPGLADYDNAARPVMMAGNVFFGGAKPSKHEAAPTVMPEMKLEVDISETGGGVVLTIDGVRPEEVPVSTELVTTERLGKAELPGQGFTRPDGSPLVIDTDYFGHARNTDAPAPGPFARSALDRTAWRVWPQAMD